MLSYSRHDPIEDIPSLILDDCMIGDGAPTLVAASTTASEHFPVMDVSSPKNVIRKPQSLHDEPCGVCVSECEFSTELIFALELCRVSGGR